jgi:hypothetical protein
MNKTKGNVHFNQNREPGSFLSHHLSLSLIGNVYEETQADLRDISRQITKLLHFVGCAIGEQYDHDEQREELVDKNRGKTERQWQLRKLRHINLELYHQIGDLLGIKLQVIDAIERQKMAELERFVEKEKRVRLKLVKTVSDKTAETRSEEFLNLLNQM